MHLGQANMDKGGIPLLLESDLIEVIDPEIRAFEGYRLVNQKGFIEYISEQSQPLPVYIREKNKLLCPCYGKVYLLIYRYNDEKKVSKKIVGRKCSKCGKNYFAPESIKNKEQYFEFIEAQDNENILIDLTTNKENKESADVTVKTSKVTMGTDLKKSIENEKIDPSIHTNEKKTGKLCKRDDDSIPPILHEVGNLEKLAAGENQSSEGAWWIMLQTAMGIYNCAVIRDPVNNSILDEFWHDVSKREDDHGVEPLLTRGGIRPLPYDDLMEIISYCGGQLQNVIENPRHSIVKTDKMVMPYRVRNTGTRTMDWLGKQSGKTIKEKLSGKNKMLTQVNEYSYDIKENQVTAMLYRMILKRVNERINFGIETQGYDADYDSPNIAKMVKIRKAMRNSKLLDIKHVNHTQANNVLLVDKNYSVIWKAYIDMCKFDSKILEKWENALELYVRSIYIAINAKLSSFCDVQTIEKRINLKSNDANSAVHIIGYETDTPLSVKLSYDDNNIHLCITEANLNGKGDAILGKYKMNFFGDMSTDLMERKGYPVCVQVRSGENIPDIHLYSDLEGINTIVNWFVCQIELKYIGKLDCFEEKIEPMAGTCTFDVLSDGIFTTVDNVTLPYIFGNKAIVYEDHSDRKIFRGNNRSVYSDATEQIRISDAVNERLQTEALMNALEDICHAVTLNPDDYLIYTVPDALEEFSQKNLKQCVNTWFHRTFPVWRSVAALTEILDKDNNNFKPDDVFVSVDLMGEIATAGLLTIKPEKRVNGYVCNHYPPFPESEVGDKITERAFFQLYVEKYFGYYDIREEEKIINNIVKSGIVKVVLLEGSKRNYTIEQTEEIRMIQIGFDEVVLEECRQIWLKNFKDFWRDIERLFPQNIQFVDILSDCIMNVIEYDDMRSIVGCENGFTGIYLSNSSNINKGAYSYIDRLRYHKPTWTEYLPELSLEVIKDGNYDQLQLIGNDVSFDVMGEDNEHVVEEKLMLKANEKEFRFPLIKKDISRTSSMIEAFISDKSFPLDHDVVVSLSVRYKYGFDNSYELTLRAIDTKERAFDEIIVEWTKVSRNANLVNIWPPNTNLYPDENVLKKIEETKESLMKIEESIEKHMVNYVGYQDKSYPIKQTDNFLNRNIFKIRNITMSSLPEATEFNDWFIGTDLYKYLGQISGIFKSQDILGEFYIDNKSRDLEFFKGDCLQVMFSIGARIPEVIQKHYVSHYYEVNEKFRMKAMLGLLLINSSNTSAIMTLIDEIRNASDEDQYSIKMDGLVKELGKICCFDSDLIYGFNNVDQSFVNEMTRYIINGLKRQLSRCERRGESYRPQKKDTKRYLAYLETVLALLRLRNPDKADSFEILAVGSEESKKLSNTIKKLDEYMLHPISGVRFNTDVLDKPESLSKMSDLSYALDLYLNGDKKAASIEVVGVDEED